MKKKPSDESWFASFTAPPLNLAASFADRVPGECDWREHLPKVDADRLALLNRSGSNRVNMFLVLAFREADKGGRHGLTWPDGWRNGAGQKDGPPRQADLWAWKWKALRESAGRLRRSAPKPKGREAIKSDFVWSGRPEALARRLGRGPFFRDRPPRRLKHEHWFYALMYLAMVFERDTGRTPTLVSRDWQDEYAVNEESFDAYLTTFCELADLPLDNLRKLFANNRRILQNLPR